MSPYGWYQLARVQHDLGQPDEAQKVLDHLAKFEPKVARQLGAGDGAQGEDDVVNGGAGRRAGEPRAEAARAIAARERWIYSPTRGLAKGREKKQDRTCARGLFAWISA